MTLAIQTAIVMVVLLIIMLAMGVSISISVGLSSAVAMLCMLPAQVSFVTSAQRLFAGANSFSLIAIPFFILAGNIMSPAQSPLHACSTVPSPVPVLPLLPPWAAPSAPWRKKKAMIRYTVLLSTLPLLPLEC